MSHDATDQARPVTSVELLNAAVWREIGWEEPQTPAAFVVGVVSGRLRINRTQSTPEGIYWAIGKEPSKGDFVFALPPAEPVFSLAKERGYLGPGPSLASGIDSAAPLTIGIVRPSAASLVWISFPSNTFIKSRASLGASFEINHSRGWRRKLAACPKAVVAEAFRNYCSSSV
jgi:hypothetical protein